MSPRGRHDPTTEDREYRPKARVPLLPVAVVEAMLLDRPQMGPAGR